MLQRMVRFSLKLFSFFALAGACLVLEAFGGGQLSFWGLAALLPLCILGVWAPLPLAIPTRRKKMQRAAMGAVLPAGRGFPRHAA